MNPEKPVSPSVDLDALLSMRGKPFVDWQEERKYLRDKWGKQGEELTLEKKINSKFTSVTSREKEEET